MEQTYIDKMRALGYTQLVCDIFPTWEDVKDEILPSDRKQGSGNGTIHVFLGAADTALRKEFPAYYEAVANGEDTTTGAIEIKHYFMPSNVLSMIGHVCKYYYNKQKDSQLIVKDILSTMDVMPDESGMFITKSLFKLSTGANKLRPYFKQFENEGVFTKLIRKILLPDSSYKISLYKNEDGEYAAFWLIGFNWQNDFEADSDNSKIQNQKLNNADTTNLTLQQIFYGAPGTGKSHGIDEQTQGESVIRTTFHPDSDYSTFVGAYKPTTKEVELRDVSGHKIIEDGKAVTEDRIVYEFVEQAFLQAYVQAWKYYAEDSENPKKQFLIIEEINRGNCAQIFGDLFQLLDRNDDGFSSYDIKPDTDIKKYIQKQDLGVSDIYDAPGEVEISDKINNGDLLSLPPNLYIWATMNTSDQSLFPIDSAFKRRWDWKYVPIDTQKESWAIEANGEKYNWGSFLEKINAEIGETTSSEDKKLGFYFCKAKDKVVSAERFVSKVLFYVYNDVFKDYGFERDFMKDENKKVMSFQSFYNVDGTINEAQVAKLLENLEVEIIPQSALYSHDENVEDSDTPTSAKEQSELRQTLLRFWEGFNERRNDNHEFAVAYSLRKASAANWMDLSFGTSKYWPSMKAIFTKNTIAVYIWIGDTPEKDIIYKAFQDHEDDINQLLDNDSISYKINGKTYALWLEKKIDLSNENNWTEAYDWMMAGALKMKEIKEKFGV